MVTEPVNKPAKQLPPLTVLYDGSCPLCRREIGIYRGLRPLDSDAPLCFADVSDAALPLPPDTTRAQLLARFHVRSSNGQMLSGAQAALVLDSRADQPAVVGSQPFPHHVHEGRIPLDDRHHCRGLQ